MEINVYAFGSTVYSSQTEFSDEDYIIVTDEKVISNDINKHYYTITEFQRLLDNHDIQMLECYFLPNKFKIKETHQFIFTLDKHKLRTSISTISSNSWVKGKKKLIVQGDYNKYLALKSIFHSIRIIGLGIQLATHGKIINYSEYNWLLTDLLKLSEQYDYVELWEKIEIKYKSLFNKLHSEFKKLAPKKISNVELDIKEIFKKENVENTKLINEIVKYIYSMEN